MKRTHNNYNLASTLCTLALSLFLTDITGASPDYPVAHRSSIFPHIKYENEISDIEDKETNNPPFCLHYNLPQGGGL